MKNVKRIIIMILSVLLLSACSPTESTAKYRSITMENAVVMMMMEQNYILLDVRTAEEYAEGHIPGAINIPNEDISDKRIKELPDKGQLIMVYCRTGRRSKEAAEKLAKLGYVNVIEIGGIEDWKGEIEK